MDHFRTNLSYFTGIFFLFSFLCIYIYWKNSLIFIKWYFHVVLLFFILWVRNYQFNVDLFYKKHFFYQRFFFSLNFKFWLSWWEKVNLSLIKENNFKTMTKTIKFWFTMNLVILQNLKKNSIFSKNQINK